VWPTGTFEALVVLLGAYAFVVGAIWLSFGLLAAQPDKPGLDLHVKRAWSHAVSIVLR